MKKKVNDIEGFINIIEEISWILDGKSVNLKDVVKQLRQASSADAPLKNSSSVTHLVGILPQLLMDKELFEKNEDLLDFAEQILKLKAKRAGNRSRTESIGWIVCELAKSDDHIRQDLVDALDSLIDNEEKKAQIKKDRKMPNFSWNDAIARLNNEL
jgi:hypothetical protein